MQSTCTYLFLAVVACFTAQRGSAMEAVTFAPDAFQARNVERSGVVAGPQGPVFETVVDAAGEKLEGTMASAQTAPLSPGLYEAAITFDAELFPDYPTLPFDMPAWLSVNAIRVAGGQPPARRPVWLHDLAITSEPLKLTVPFEVTGAPSAYRIGLDWRTRTRVPGLGKATTRVHGITLRRIDTGCFIRSVLTDTVVAAPGGSATAVCDVVNVGDKPWTGTLAIQLLAGVDDRQSLETVEISVPAGETTTIRRPFEVGPQLFGRGLVATLATGSGPVHSRETAFTVADQFWDVALGTVNGGLTANSGMYGDRAGPRQGAGRPHAGTVFQLV